MVQRLSPNPTKTHSFFFIFFWVHFSLTISTFHFISTASHHHSFSKPNKSKKPKTYASPFLFPPQSSFKNVYNISLIPSSSIRIMNQREWVRLKICVREFMIGVSELTVEFGKGCRDIVKQSLVNQDSFLVRKFGKSWNRVRGPCNEMFKKLSFFNQYLPEDKDPLHVWSVIFFVSLLAFSG